MDRRKFLGCAAISSVALTAPNALAQSKDKEKQIKCKITVLKRTVNSEYFEKYKKQKGHMCPVFKEGQEFILEAPWSAPEKFCDWAWADIRNYIIGVFAGMDFGGTNSFVACCTDGFRPVFFKIERHT